ncbi:MAG: DUF362 domain-containing protein [Deltaproteobacteria bacterium]|nr:DUF362 domain-containing protein [Deltaproteobacteria bacterium]MBW1948747.1 DUF362 domain-containing protein [Deltaproteobacteria bacterium]MBW2006425.1 DUF362 domain-containing protein [Deltaproteobacteria bacterium]MBW2102047.1 DUF362 domain-containing protein [Deltaproteobacteria bacterium]RLB37206.1 MAG: DUF362 domain-containing protein [Deltaproteobacteria bacterium]
MKAQEKSVVSVVRYEKPLESVRRAVELCGGLRGLKGGAHVFIKPNVVFWTRSVPFPKWGVITTSRVIEDMVVILKEEGAGKITIGEGMVLFDPRDRETPADAFERLGYSTLGKRYGVRCVNVWERPFRKVDLGDGVQLKFNVDILDSDFVVDIPVMKTHSQTVVSLSIKNLKGVLDRNSRRDCHSADPEKDLHYMVSRLPRALPPSFALLDGIYTCERGPGFDGKVWRKDLLVASADMFSADMVGAKILGHDPGDVPYLAHLAREKGRPADLSDVEARGVPIKDVASLHRHTFPYTEDGSLPLPMKRLGIKGFSYRKFDSSMCTYCSLLAGPLLTAIARAWKGEPWDEVEVLNGKMMKPTPGKKITILLGKCMYQANKDHPDIQRMIAVKKCPPAPKDVVRAFHEAGVPIAPDSLDRLDLWPGQFMKRYEGNPEFDESLFTVS